MKLAILVTAFITGGVIVAWMYGVIGPEIISRRTQVIMPRHPAAKAIFKEPHIVFLGTSLTTKGNWQEDLANALGNCAYSDAAISRLAKAGANSTWGKSKLAAYLADPNSPKIDILIVEFAINDASFYKGVPLFMSQRNHQAIIDLARSNNSIVFLATMSPPVGLRALERPGLSRYYAAYRQLADMNGIGLIDTVDDWYSLPKDEWDRLIPSDGHPGDRAMRLMIEPAMRRALSGLCPY